MMRKKCVDFISVYVDRTFLVELGCKVSTDVNTTQEAYACHYNRLCQQVNSPLLAT